MHGGSCSGKKAAEQLEQNHIKNGAAGMPSAGSPIPLARIHSPNFLTEDRPLQSPHLDDNELFPHSRSLEESELDTIHPLWKRDLHALLEHPKSSSPAFFLHAFLTFLIVSSALVTVLETVPAFHSINGRIWFGLETGLVALFTMEYVARCLAWSNTWSSLAKWLFSFFGVIDFLAIFPYYLEILLHQDTSVFFRFSILRMFRLLRVFRPFRYNHTILLTIEVMYLSVRRSQYALFAIGFFVVMILTVFSTLLYFAERGTWDSRLETFINVNGDPTQFSSIPAAAWFVLVTITTVGYGEITPRSLLGRLVTLPLLMFGLLLVALPSFVLGREFSIVWEKMSRKTREYDDILLTNNRSPATSMSGHDLSNLKLAENQTELSRQIAELRTTIEEQGVMVDRLINLLDKGKQRERS